MRPTAALQPRSFQAECSRLAPCLLRMQQYARLVTWNSTFPPPSASTELWQHPPSTVHFPFNQSQPGNSHADPRPAGVPGLDADVTLRLGIWPQCHNFPLQLAVVCLPVPAQPLYAPSTLRAGSAVIRLRVCRAHPVEVRRLPDHTRP